MFCGLGGKFRYWFHVGSLMQLHSCGVVTRGRRSKMASWLAVDASWSALVPCHVASYSP